MEKNPDSQCRLRQIMPNPVVLSFSRITVLVLGKTQRILIAIGKLMVLSHDSLASKLVKCVLD